jgi:hypothetical protein
MQPDMQHTVLITGATAGIGYHTRARSHSVGTGDHVLDADDAIDDPGHDGVPQAAVARPAAAAAGRIAREGRQARRPPRLLPAGGSSRGEHFTGGTRPKRLWPRALHGANQERAWQLASQLVADAPTGRRQPHPAEDTVRV